MKSTRNHLIRTFASCAAVCAIALNANAASLTWDGSGNGSNPNSSGTWNTSNTNWNSGAATWNNANNDTAIFGTGTGTVASRAVTLGENITVGGITFNSPGGFTISGGFILTLGGTNPAITLAVNSTISAIIAGTNGLNAVASASNKTLALNGLNTYTGVTSVGSGLILAVNTLANGGSASSIGAGSSSASDLVLAGTLNYTGAGSSTDRLFTINNTLVTLGSNGTGAVNFTNTGHLAVTTAASGTLALNGTNTGNNNLSAAIDNPTGFTTGVSKSGTGHWILSGDSSYTGVTTVTGGTLSATTLANGGVNSSIGAAANTADKLVLDGGAFRYVGSGASTDRLFTVAKNGGVLDASGTGAVNFTNTGSIAFGSGTGTSTRTLTLAGTNTGSNTLAASYGDKGGTASVSSLIKVGTGKWIITGTHTYTGGTQVNEGTLVLGSATTLQGATGAVVINGGTLSSNVTDTTIGGDVTLATGFMTPGDTGIGKMTFAAGKDFSMTGGEIHLTLGISFDQLAGGAGSNFSLTGGFLVLDVTGSGFSYENSYQVFLGFDAAGNVVTLGDGTTGLMITGYDTSLWTANLDAATGTVSFTSIPEPGTNALLGLGLVLWGRVLFLRRRTVTTLYI